MRPAAGPDPFSGPAPHGLSPGAKARGQADRLGAASPPPAFSASAASLRTGGPRRLKEGRRRGSNSEAMSAVSTESAARKRTLIRGVTGTALCCLAAALVAGGWLSVEEPWRPRVRTGDGSTLTLLGTTYGASHVPPDPRRWWERLLHDGGRPAGLTPVMRTTRKNTVVVWTRNEGPEPIFVLRIEDEHGCMFGARDIHVVGQLLGSNRSFQTTGWEFENYPRRSGSLQVVLGTAETPHGGTLTVENPTPGSYPQWRARPLPATARAGDLEFLLVSFPPVPRGQFSAAPPVFRIRRGGKPLPGWWVRDFTLSDAPGNQFFREISPFRAIMSPRFCGREGAWKLRVELAPVAPSPVPPDRVWTTPPLRLAAGEGSDGGATFHFREPDLNGRGLAVVRLARQRRKARRGVPAGHRVEVVSVARYAREAPRNLQPLLLRAVDDRGRPARVVVPIGTFANESLSGPWTRQAGANARLQVHELEPAAGARSLRLTFGVYRTQTVDLTFRPQ